MALVAPAVPNSLQVASQEPGSNPRRVHSGATTGNLCPAFPGKGSIYQRLKSMQCSSTSFISHHIGGYSVLCPRLCAITSGSVIVTNKTLSFMFTRSPQSRDDCDGGAQSLPSVHILIDKSISIHPKETVETYLCSIKSVWANFGCLTDVHAHTCTHSAP